MYNFNLKDIKEVNETLQQLSDKDKIEYLDNTINQVQELIDKLEGYVFDLSELKKEILDGQDKNIL